MECPFCDHDYDDGLPEGVSPFGSEFNCIECGKAIQTDYEFSEPGEYRCWIVPDEVDE
jgi:hypothetical protein